MLDSINAKSLIKANMPVVCSDSDQLAVVDHLAGGDVIKLAKDAQGEHHYIPLTWVSSVDDKVHLDRTAGEVREAWTSVTAAPEQELVARVLERKQELEVQRDALPAEDIRARAVLDVAIGTISALLTGDLEHLPPAIAAEMTRWLETHQQLPGVPLEPMREIATAPLIQNAGEPARTSHN